MKKHSFLVRCALCILVLSSTACTLSRSKEAVSFKDLLINSSEIVSFGISDTASVHTISAWIDEDLPSYASLSCSYPNKQCQDVLSLLQARNIPVKEEILVTNGNSVSLSYDHISARKCPAHVFGCSVSENAFRMISDYNQILKPTSSSTIPHNASHAVDAYRRSQGRNL